MRLAPGDGSEDADGCDTAPTRDGQDLVSVLAQFFEGHGIRLAPPCRSQTDMSDALAGADRARQGAASRAWAGNAQEYDDCAAQADHVFIGESPDALTHSDSWNGRDLVDHQAAGLV